MPPPRVRGEDEGSRRGKGPIRRLHMVLLPPRRRPGYAAPGGDAWSPLMPIGDRPLFEHQLALLEREGVTDIHVADARFAGALRERYETGRVGSIDVHFAPRRHDVPGRNAALRLAVHELDDDELVLCMDGNTLSGQRLAPLIRWHVRRTGLATVLLVPFAPHEAVRVDRAGTVLGFERTRVRGYWTNAGVYVLSRALLRRLGAQGDPEDRTLPLLTRERRLHGYKSHAPWLALWTTDDGDEALRLLGPSPSVPATPG